LDQKKKDFAKERNMQKIAKKCIYSKAMLVNCKDSCFLLHEPNERNFITLK
jgi:hypothetical protein